MQSYIQLLWKEIAPNETDLYNGAVEALITLLGAMSAFAAGLLDSKRFHRYEVWILTALTCIEAILLLWAAFTSYLWCCYIAYIVFGIIYQFMVTVARYDFCVLFSRLEKSFRSCKGCESKHSIFPFSSSSSLFAVQQLPSGYTTTVSL